MEPVPLTTRAPRGPRSSGGGRSDTVELGQGTNDAAEPGAGANDAAQCADHARRCPRHPTPSGEPAARLVPRARGRASK